MKNNPSILEIVSDWILEQDDWINNLIPEDKKGWIFKVPPDGPASNVLATPVMHINDWRIGFRQTSETAPGHLGVLLYDYSCSDGPQEYHAELNPAHPDFFDQIIEIFEKGCEAPPWDIPRHHWPCYNKEVGIRACPNTTNFEADDYRFPRDGRCEDCWEIDKVEVCTELDMCYGCYRQLRDGGLCWECLRAHTLVSSILQ